jgi:hypothetical protein
MSSKSHTQEMCGTLRKTSFSGGGYAEIAYEKFLD